MAKPRLYVAPASAGKTTFALARAREAAQGLKAEARLCVSGRLQVASCRRRLAKLGGAVGVRVMTFDQLYDECLGDERDTLETMGDAAQYRLLRTITEQLSLDFYESLIDKPGFIQMQQDFISDLKAARIFPKAYLQGVSDIGREPRLREPGVIYRAYQDYLAEKGWADYAGLAWLAVERLEKRDEAAREWPVLIVDGFDSFTEVQLDLLKILAGRVGEFIITLTGADGKEGQRQVFNRFNRTREQLENALNVRADRLPDQFLAQDEKPSDVLGHIQSGLFVEKVDKMDGAGIINMVQAPDRAAEVREALRWLKEQIVSDGMGPADVALLAREAAPYRTFVLQTAAEFGMSIHIVDGLPLGENTVIVALLELLRLASPSAAGPTLPRKGVVAAWRSPYFDWANVSVNISPADADALDAAGRWGRVIGGLAQWSETLRALSGREAGADPERDEKVPAGVVAGPQAEALADKFARFRKVLEPPQDQHSYGYFANWLRELIGFDSESSGMAGNGVETGQTRSLNIIERAGANDSTPADSLAAGLDVAALNKLDDVLRDMVWIDKRTEGGETVDFGRFFVELAGSIEAATYQLGNMPGRHQILFASALRVRGLPFKAVAVLGLAEGEFPATLREDPLLPEVDRDQLRRGGMLALDSAIESSEREFFYEVVTAASQKLLLTRPRLADGGAEWLPSPFWDEIGRLVDVETMDVKTERDTPPGRAASPAEVVESLVHYPNHQAARAWLERYDPDRWNRLVRASRIFGDRYQNASTEFDGQLTGRNDAFAARFQPEHAWSPSSLESYLACPMLFFVGRALRLELRLEPAEGLDARQLGTIYHAILETLYRRTPLAERNDAQKLLAALPEVAGPILDRAPKEQGFRETAWWRQTREEIEENVARSIVALTELADRWSPLHFEARFFGQQALTVSEGGESFRLVGVIDRVDQDPEGRIRVIDYKTAGASGYGRQALEQGQRIQLPLYALAARDALGLGQPADGFYWHIWQAQASALTMVDYGPEEAIEIALEYAWRAVMGARQGHFVPETPRGGCPGYCPAAAFCWHYRGRR
ncbi:MAG: exodeoxyribonuclease V subunit gamma [Chloroflexota bacterium]|nr:MAG: exodeoxyribonuclease V subunit gamma [Chloroflexota bacterium]